MQNVFFLLCVLWCSSLRCLVFAQKGVCPGGWVRSHSANCYKFIEDFEGSFWNCLRKCEAQNASLACVRNDADNSFLIDLLMFDGDSRGPAFIGLTDVFKEGSFQWVAKDCKSDFVKWANPEHGGNKIPDIEDCATMPPWHDLVGSSWNDEKCQCSRGCICEYGMTTKDEYSEHGRNQTSEPVLDCNDDLGAVVIIVVVSIVGICCVTGVSLCICYKYKLYKRCCCWDKRNSASVSGAQSVDTSIVLGRPVVEGHVVHVGK
eukprot:TRINITY_DN15181_c0_g1_i1.p1 TRINITY_DN15181_c0_g1~~TRINITY_DN15181_c0_g1_i1.p1  ORF type:complete len:261 (-),score=34.64 TRINITY_DN15181_c0_g1_i1:555-1337(-)